ncbi:hypothetical protein [Clostridium saccharobutylicum]|uniref:Uncharacterized protein n=1 Tax=Clostridium saccharobutylicum TaxID=169679 RepID=A0A1S8MNB9_CLOSA|nr:hypothetical protein [Clostridium saccharobutylicum]OOM05685.1 hypothetical protein CLOSAC_45540 [Clostridium saccharobutylicum]
MSNTTYKLEESRFFLDKMIENRKRLPDFDYYFNAYISSARSILWIMKNEYTHKDGWKEWYNSIETTKEEDEFNRNINELRVRSLKKNPPRTKEYVGMTTQTENIDIINEIREFMGGKTKMKCDISFEPINENEALGVKKDSKKLSISGKVVSYRTIDEFKNEDVIKIAKKYFEWLEVIVDGCETRFKY